MRQSFLLPMLLFVCGAATAFGHTVSVQSDGGVTTLHGDAFGTTFTIRVAADLDEAARSDLTADVDADIDRLNRQMSLWDVDSELSRFNRAGKDEWFAVSPEFLAVVEAALAVRTRSGGAFDPTVCPLLSLWSFGPEQRPRTIPGDEDIAAARALAGAVIEIRRHPQPALRKLQDGVELDLNAIAKGFAVDVIAERVAATHARGFMVEIGGEVRTQGTKPDGSPWRIAIEQPIAGTRVVGSAIELNDAALATSGDYRNYFEMDGQRFSHTINPHTGRPITHNLASVSVIAGDCMTADAWATALMVLGPEEGYDWAGQENIPALFLARTGDGFTSRTTAGFPPLISLSTPAALSSRGASLPWSTFLLAVAVFGIAVAAMAIGVILKGRRLRGSCGGLSGLKDANGNPLCDACTTPAEECDEFRRRMTPQ